jgi:hypothetical protein
MRGEASLDDKGRFVVRDEQRGPRPMEDMSFSCAKCASRSGSTLETVYHERPSTQSAPPAEMEVKGWLFLGLGSGLALAGLQPGFNWSGYAFGMLALVAAIMGIRATLYNRRRLPLLRIRWEKSAMCSRCGHVVVIEQ